MTQIYYLYSFRCSYSSKSCWFQFCFILQVIGYTVCFVCYHSLLHFHADIGCSLFSGSIIQCRSNILLVRDACVKDNIDNNKAWLRIILLCVSFFFCSIIYCIFITLNGFVNSKYIFYALRNVWMVRFLLFNLAFFFVCSFVQWE